MLMNDIFMERKALAACLINSAVLMLVTTIGRCSGRVEAWSGFRAPVRIPLRTRCGRDGRNPPSALPSRRNSGLEATSKSGGAGEGRPRVGLACRQWGLPEVIAHNRSLQPLRGYGGHGAFFDDEFVPVQIARHHPRHRFHLTKVGLAAGFLRGADTDEDDGAGANRGFHVIDRLKSAALEVFRQQVARGRVRRKSDLPPGSGPPCFCRHRRR